MDENIYSYRCKLVRVVDADTSVVDIDLGFGVHLNNQYIRFYGIDTPESRTRNLARS
jgi:micrococcal nuclease